MQTNWKRGPLPDHSTTHDISAKHSVAVDPASDLRPSQPNDLYPFACLQRLTLCFAVENEKLLQWPFGGHRCSETFQPVPLSDLNYIDVPRPQPRSLALG